MPVRYLLITHFGHDLRDILVHGRDEFTSESGIGDQAPPTQDTRVLRLGGEGDTTLPLPQIHSMEYWMHIHHTRSHEGFLEIANHYKDATCLSCVDVSGVALLHLSLIHQYAYGGWHGTLEIQECLDDNFNPLRLDPL